MKILHTADKSIQGEILYCETELSTYEKKAKDEPAYRLELKLGQLYLSKNDITTSLHYFELAHDTAAFLASKFFQVDALCKIVEVYRLKGELDISLIYSDRIDKLLENFDYIEGYLENSIQKITIFQYKNEVYKAREIGNEAIRLCGNNYLFYKGRILNILADVFSELISSEEQLELLLQALACFEEAKAIKGIMAVLNNIASLYSDNVQDHGKAFEYLFKLKKLGEENNNLEAITFACINIGDFKLRCLEYEEGTTWLKLALENAPKTNNINLIFRSRVYFLNASIKLYNLNEAFKCFELTTLMLKDYSNQGSGVLDYHKIVSNLMLEVGQLEKAQMHIEKAINLIGNEDAILKWEIGFIYELTKLKGKPNIGDAVTSLDGLKFVLSKFKNSEEVLDYAYDAVIELIHSENTELAFRLADEYTNIECKNEKAKLKIAYVEAMRQDPTKETTLHLLNNCLESAKKSTASKLLWRIYYSIGDYYFSHDSYKKAEVYYSASCECIRAIILSIPEKYRLQFAHFHDVQKPFNNLKNLKQKLKN